MINPLFSKITFSQERPNILYIFTDDQSYRTLSCYEGSYPFIKTLNIDRLAENGIRFTQAYVGVKCVPSRAIGLTGRLQYNIGGKIPLVIGLNILENKDTLLLLKWI